MSLWRFGREGEACAVASKAAAGMKPLPGDDQGPVAVNFNPDNMILILWLACKEAAAMIGLAEPRAASAKPDAR
jgi:hypothetical protein